MIWPKALLSLSDRLRRMPVPYTLCLPLCAFGAIIAAASWGAFVVFNRCLAANPEIAAVFVAEHTPQLIGFATKAGLALSAFLVLAGLLGLAVKKPWTLTLIRYAYTAIYIGAFAYVFVVIELTGIVSRSGLAIDGLVMDTMRVAVWLIQYMLAACVVVGFAARFHLNALRASAITTYAGPEPRKIAFGDLAVESLRQWLSNPRFKSASASILVHFTIFFFPLILALFNTVTPYLVPYGKGNPDAGGGAQKAKEKKAEAHARAMAKMKVTVKKRRDVKGLVFDSKAGKTANIDSSLDKDMADLDLKTENTFDMRKDVIAGGHGTGTGGGRGPGSKAGGIGKGGTGPGGWPNGMKGAIVRFIHIEYDGEGWNDGMQEDTRGDMNFLEFFKDETGFEIASKPESNHIRQLTQYPKLKSPPFLYFTGKGGINIPPGDYKILRDYLIDGGMLFASCSSRNWHHQFMHFASVLFPDNPLVDISDDDPIFKQPNDFPNGAPPLWHMGGMRAKGIKVNGRWVVFYHPGDINDAWKTGHSGMESRLADGAFLMGLNIIHYAFTQRNDALEKGH